MKIEDLKVGMIFKDNDNRSANRYLKISSINWMKSIAKIHRFLTIDCIQSYSGRNVYVKIMLNRLVNEGNRGYTFMIIPEVKVQ